MPQLLIRRVTALTLALLILPATNVLATSSALVVGPGPQRHYSVRVQPAAGHCHYRFSSNHNPLPDAHCTPGAINPKVTQGNLATTICRSGYSASIRPPESVTSVEMRANARSYNYRGSLAQAEYDHLISLELGGDPNDPRNLWVEPPSPGHRSSQGFTNPKDTVENRAHQLVCSRVVRLAVMQRAMAKNWLSALASVGHPIALPTPSAPSRTKIPKGAPYDFANCTALRRVFAHGVGRVGAVDHTSGALPVTNFTRSNAWYNKNASHDKDRDGISCEHH